MNYLIENLAQNIDPELGIIILNLLIIYIGLVWLTIVIWGVRDAFIRSKSTLFRLLSIVLIVILNIFGLLIYLIIRPPRTHNQKTLEEIEYQALTEEIKENICSKCNHNIDPDFCFCPKCTTEIKVKCGKCRKNIKKSWKNMSFLRN